MLTSSLPHPVPTISSDSAFKTRNDVTYDIWIFNTGATFNIIAQCAHHLELIHCHVGLTVGGGGCLHATHMGSVQLDMSISGSVHCITLSVVVYIPARNETFLISCRKIDILCDWLIVGEVGIITVKRKCEPSPVIIAESMHVCYQVLRFARHNKIYTAATDFCHQASAHSSTPFCRTATDIYADGSIYLHVNMSSSALHVPNTRANSPYLHLLCTHRLRTPST